MVAADGWEQDFWSEIEKADSARLSHNEGRARVCARRAAGIAAGEYLRRRGELVRNWSAYRRLLALKSLPDLPQPLQEIIDHLTLHVDQDHKFPPHIDLLAEAQELKVTLLGE